MNGQFFFPGVVMGQLLRGKMLEALRGLYARGAFPELSQAVFGELLAALARHKSWVVHDEHALRKDTLEHA